MVVAIPACLSKVFTKDSPFCPPQNCHSNSTCCTKDDGSPGCCSYINATCCGVFNSCCPSGFACDPVVGSCVNASHSETCGPCQSVINMIASKGCTGACSILPAPANTLCVLLEKLVGCQAILNWIFADGKSSFDICALLGFCSGETCACGYCTRFQQGRCLSVPNHCPKSLGFDSERELKIEAKESFSKVEDKICWAGECAPESYGCCLTCL